MNKVLTDVIVIGAGASGLMTCVSLREHNADIKILLIDKNEKIGKKLYITGKGRCNVTNNSDTQNIVENILHNNKFLYNALNKCPPLKVINFFENNGCKLKTERGNRVFPESEKSSDIIKVFSNYINKNNIDLILNTKVNHIKYCDDVFEIYSDNQCFVCKYLVIATGGKSYPLTGSTGDGYKFAKLFGHTIQTLKPALCGFKCNGVGLLEGLTLKNIELKVLVDGKIKFKQMGDIVFYKNLISGPLCLTASSLLNEYSKFDLSIDLKPNVEMEEFKNRYFKIYNSSTKTTIFKFLQNFMPIKLCEYMISLNNLNKNDIINNIPITIIKDILYKIKDLKFDKVILDDIDNGIVTAGGVNIKEINPSNMQSKIRKNLFFVGEVLDLDAFTGGYNMQIAFSTGYACGEFIALDCEKF